MTNKELWDSFLLLGQGVILEFSSPADRKACISALRVYAHRWNAMNEKLSGRGTEVKIRWEYVSLPPKPQVRIWLGEKKVKEITPFKILSHGPVGVFDSMGLVEPDVGIFEPMK